MPDPERTPRPEGEHAEGPPPHAEGDPEAKARSVCLRMLSTAPRTRAQLEQALARCGVPPEAAEAVLGRFGEVGLIDDAAFAEAWVDSRHAGRGLGRRALTAELRRRGVAEETVQEAVAGLSPEQEEATARDLARRRLAASRGRATEIRVRRAIGALARKGYPAGLAYRVVREELEAEGAQVELPDPDEF